MRQNTPSPIIQTIQRQTRRRLTRLLRASQVTLMLAALLMLYMHRPHDAAVFVVTFFLLIFVGWTNNQGKYRLATHILLFGLTIMLSIIAWLTSGLYGIVTLGFSGVLLFSAMLGGRIQLTVLLSIMVCVSLLIALSSQLGIKSYDPAPTTIATAITASIILIAISYCAYLMAKDYQIAATNLVIENTRLTQMMHRIEHLALHNSLTALPNRNYAETVFNKKHDQAMTHEELMAVLILDVDNLHTVNESLGHQAGDKILKDVAHRLSQIPKLQYFISHFGGDEFVMILSGIRDQQCIEEFCSQLLKTLSENYYYQDVEIFCTVSIGAAISPKDGNEFHNLLRKADIALHQAKNNGRNNFQFYKDDQTINVRENLGFISDIQKGITDRQFHLVYQPKIVLATQKPCGFEVLLRWQHPRHGNISPEIFIPIAESSGLIVPLGEWVIRTACDQARSWLDMGFDDFTLAINTSSIQFKRNSIETILLDALESSRIPASMIELEMTESLLIHDDEKLTVTLANLRRMGVHLTIDDFGTGYSNLGYLKTFEVGTLKIDQSFVRKMDDSPEDEAIVQAIIQMCLSLDILCVAEGVENTTIAEKLTALGCTHAQGYYWSPPLSPEGAQRFWQERMKK